MKLTINWKVFTIVLVGWILFWSVTMFLMWLDIGSYPPYALPWMLSVIGALISTFLGIAFDD